jgi:hypothetical protein
MALSKALVRGAISQFERGLKIALPVKSAAVLYDGALCQYDAIAGPIHPYAGAGAERLAGWHFGDTVTGDGTIEAEIFTGPGVLHNIEVGGGLAGTTADLGKQVWVTDDGTYTVEDPGGGHRIGTITRFISTTHANVAVYSVGGMLGTLDVLPTPTPSPTPTPTPTPT